MGTVLRCPFFILSILTLPGNNSNSNSILDTDKENSNVTYSTAGNKIK